MDWDTGDQGELRVAYRAHMRDMTAARQAAERARGLFNRDPSVRRSRQEAFVREMARIAEQHDAWLLAHGLSDPQAVRKPFSRG